MHLHDRVKQQIRLLGLFHAAHEAGLSPLSSTRVHQLVYLVNALSPVWDVEPMTPELLKVYGTPYDARLQADLNSLAGKALVRATNLRYVKNERGYWQVHGSYSLNHRLAEPALGRARAFPDESEAMQIAKEVCLALSALAPDEIDTILKFDVALADPSVGPNALISLYDDTRSNPTSRSANLFQEAFGGSLYLSPSEAASLYVRHLQRLAFHVA